MKKFLIIILSLACTFCLAFGLTACDDNNSEGGNTGGGNAHTHLLTVTQAKTATCTENGNIEYWTCGSCGKYFSDNGGKNEISKEDTVVLAGHKWSDAEVTTKATCTESGVKTYTCSVCKEMKMEKIAASGHKPSTEWTGDSEYHWHACLNGCGEKCSRAKHSFNKGVCSSCGRKKPTEGLEYTLNTDKASYSVSGKGTAAVTDLIIPSVYNGLPVTSIGGAFYNCTELTSVTIPESINDIYYYAFGSCGGLTSLLVEKGNTKYHSAGNCIIETAAKTLVIGCKNSVIPTDGSVKIIGKRAFSDCRGLTDLKIPKGVTVIGDSAFLGCSSLTSVVLPSGLTSIGEQGFNGCTSLTSITIPESVKDIGSYSFSGCNGLTIYCETAEAPYGWGIYWNFSKNTVVWNCRYNDKDSGGYAYTVFKGVRYAVKDGEAAVAKQPTNITAADIESSVTYKGKTYNVTAVGNSAFYNCSELVSINIPDSIHSVGKDAFKFCEKLIQKKGVVSYVGKWVVDCGEGAYITLRDDTVGIADKAFENNRFRLSQIAIPVSLNYIGDSAFSSCYYLSTINYEGTKEQWQAVEKGSDWKFGTDKFKLISCTDGDLDRNGNEI